MATYIVLNLKAVHNLDWVGEYYTNVPPLVREFGGEYLGISNFPNGVQSLEGAIPLASVVFRFPSADAVRAFWESPAYRPYRDARQAGSDSDIYAFDNDETAPQFKVR